MGRRAACETRLEPVPAKVIIEDDLVYYLKRCWSHGVQHAPISAVRPNRVGVPKWTQPKLSASECR
jgi:hypothetical protein